MRSMNVCGKPRTSLLCIQCRRLILRLACHGALSTGSVRTNSTPLWAHSVLTSTSATSAPASLRHQQRLPPTKRCARGVRGSIERSVFRRNCAQRMSSTRRITVARHQSEPGRGRVRGRRWSGSRTRRRSSHNSRSSKLRNAPLRQPQLRSPAPPSPPPLPTQAETGEGGGRSIRTRRAIGRYKWFVLDTSLSWSGASTDGSTLMATHTLCHGLTSSRRYGNISPSPRDDPLGRQSRGGCRAGCLQVVWTLQVHRRSVQHGSVLCYP